MAFGHSAHACTSILNDFAVVLATDWGLEIKNGSRDVIVCRGMTNDAAEEWQRVRLFNCLGHKISHDCGVRSDWLSTKPMLWAVFYKNSHN